MVKNIKFFSTVSGQLQQKINISIIFNYLRNNSPKSRAEISKDLKISAAAVSRAIEHLLKRKYVVETGKVKTKSGKRPILIKLSEKKGIVLGIDLGKEKIRIKVSDLNGKSLQIYEGSEITDKLDIGEKLVTEIKKTLEKIKKSDNIASDKLKAICVGVCAEIDTVSGNVLEKSLNYESWKNLNLKKLLSNEFNVFIHVDNDVNLSALGERNHIENQEVKNFIFVEISKGIGAGIIIEHHLYRGSSGSAGKIGFSIIGKENLEYKITDRGYLENYASVESLKDEAIKKIKEGVKSNILELAANDIESIEPTTVCRAAISGDGLARSIIKNMVDVLSVCLVNLIFSFDPQMLILGGRICKLPQVYDLFVEPIKNRINAVSPYKIPEIKLSAFLDDAGIEGASYQAINILIKEKFPYEIEQNI